MRICEILGYHVVVVGNMVGSEVEDGVVKRLKSYGKMLVVNGEWGNVKRSRWSDVIDNEK